MWLIAGNLPILKTDKLIDSKGLSTAGDVKGTFVLEHCIDKITEYIDQLNKIDAVIEDLK